jgi:tetratricopeptide (TPR) repeat protein
MDHKAGAAGILSLRAVMDWVLPVALGVSLLLGLALLPGCYSQGNARCRAFCQIRPANNTALLVQNAAYLKRAGRLELAVEDLEEAHLQDPDNKEILDALTQTYEELGDYDRAEELYEEALARGGHNPAIENNRCYSLYLQGRLDQAETCFRKVLASQPDNKAARNNLGLVLCRQGREAEALAMWREALSDGEARQHLGQALAALGKEVPPSLAGSAPDPAELRVAAAAPESPGVRQLSSPAPQAMAAPSPSTHLAASPITTPAPNSAQAPLSEKATAPSSSPDLASPSTKQPLASVFSSPHEAALSRAAAVAATAVSPVVKSASAACAATSAAKKTKDPVLTVLDLVITRIEVKNGNGSQDQARELRTRLCLGGFTVVGIGNHIDFGLEDTVIAYRPESAKVAQALAQKFFPAAKLEKGGKLSRGADIRISLGRDQLGEHNMAASLAEINTGDKQATSPPVTPRCPTVDAG